MTPNRRKRAVPEESVSSPRVADPCEDTADWVERWTLTNKDGNTSFAELCSAMNISGSADGYIDSDEFEFDETEGPAIDVSASDDSHLYEAAAEATFTELSDRISACGETRYPFTVTKESVASNDLASNSIYTFLLLLNKYGPDAGPNRNEGAKLFEEVCAHALTRFLGGKEGHADAQVFGFPRRVSCDGFANALTSLCNRLGEGQGAKLRPTTLDQKDGKLDVVGWKGFSDGRKGKLILFGQCATGVHWRDKKNELAPTHDWCTKWMMDRPNIWPIRSFFVPHRVSSKEWFDTCTDAGLLFDRCRLTYYAEGLLQPISDEIAAWCRYVIDHLPAQ